MGSARAGFQGRIKMGFRADGRVTAVDLYIVQENGPNDGFNDWRRRPRPSRWSISRWRCASAACP